MLLIFPFVCYMVHNNKLPITTYDDDDSLKSRFSQKCTK